MNPTMKGDIATLAVALALAKRGEHVLFPFSDGLRYDLALDRDGAMQACQNPKRRIAVQYV